MKVSINKNLKLILIVALIILICVSSFFIFKEAKSNKTKEEKITLYTYNSGAAFNYKVHLKPNMLFKENVLDEGQIYISEFVKHIESIFTFQFNGENEADIKGDYEIKAVLEGYTGEGESLKNIWKKEFSIIDRKDFQAEDKDYFIEDKITIKLDKFQDFIKEVSEVAKISSSVKFAIQAQVNMEAETDNGIINKTYSPTMLIPLDGSYFEIGGNLKDEQNGVIDETKKISLPVNRNRIIILSIVAGICLLALIYVLFFTIPVVIDEHEKELKKIFKNHGDRLVALNEEGLSYYGECIKVKSIDDLVRISDEVGKPIMYKYSSDYSEISKFYVISEKELYLFKSDIEIDNMGIENKENQEVKNQTIEIIDVIE
ncbi:DUF5305 domain-containing protein [Oceanirhabdus seepicola]|uniref:DUF5305 domain-containing protein n=1 Tax=Oceanirhabdus seepicola TaxID=2828781 RepID=A0A9J6P2E5_9CLOT|nr:DUF5305 domain-containing protein [Oceanirhabdus seepicola]MCM1990233.1 DUF5305 domain-containing protein [Oceanirhabdus seepicola]